jgi:hypothetical protein
MHMAAARSAHSLRLLAAAPCALPAVPCALAAAPCPPAPCPPAPCWPTASPLAPLSRWQHMPLSAPGSCWLATTTSTTAYTTTATPLTGCLHHTSRPQLLAARMLPSSAPSPSTSSHVALLRALVLFVLLLTAPTSCATSRGCRQCSRQPAEAQPRQLRAVQAAG